MKICRQALYAQVIDEEGTVRACGWAGYYILGKLTEQGMHEIYHGEAAKRFQQSLIEKTYDYCNAENCPYMANGTLDEQLVEIDEIPYYPQILSLAYERRCNYKCTCCISQNNVRLQENNRKSIEDELNKVVPHVKILSANGLGELFVSESILDVISQWNPLDEENASFEIETNGSLFNEENWRRIENLGKYNLKVFLTVHSFEQDAYQYLSGTALPITQIERNLEFVKQLRENNVINYLEIATVVQERNFRTLPYFVERCLNEYKADRVRVRRFLPEKAMDENIEWFFDVRNPLHPYHKEYLKMMKNPIFKHPRVFIWTGEHLSNRGDIPAKVHYDVLKKICLIPHIADKWKKYLAERGYSRLVLYAVTDIAKVLLNLFADNRIEVIYLYDRNTKLEECMGMQVRRPTHYNLQHTEEPILVTLAARHNEIEDNLRNAGFSGDILKLEDVLKELENMQE